MNATERIARFISRTRYEDIPPAVLTTQERFMLQQQGLMVQEGQQQALANEAANLMQLNALIRKEPDPFTLTKPREEPVAIEIKDGRKSLADLFDDSTHLIATA